MGFTQEETKLYDMYENLLEELAKKMDIREKEFTEDFTYGKFMLFYADILSKEDHGIIHEAYLILFFIRIVKFFLYNEDDLYMTRNLYVNFIHVVLNRAIENKIGLDPDIMNELDNQIYGMRDDEVKMMDCLEPHDIQIVLDKFKEINDVGKFIEYYGKKYEYETSFDCNELYGIVIALLLWITCEKESPHHMITIYNVEFLLIITLNYLQRKKLKLNTHFINGIREKIHQFIFESYF